MKLRPQPTGALRRGVFAAGTDRPTGLIPFSDGGIFYSPDGLFKQKALPRNLSRGSVGHPKFFDERVSGPCVNQAPGSRSVGHSLDRRIEQFYEVSHEPSPRPKVR